MSASCCFLYGVFLPHSLSHDFFQQSLVTVHHIINHIAVTYGLEVFPCAVDLCLFNWSDVVKMQGIQSTFGLGNEVNMLNRSFIEGNRSVRIITSYRSEIHRCTQVVGSLSGGNFSLMLVCVRLRHVAGTQWGNKKYMNMKHLEATLEDVSIAG